MLWVRQESKLQSAKMKWKRNWSLKRLARKRWVSQKTMEKWPEANTRPSRNPACKVSKFQKWNICFEKNTSKQHFAELRWPREAVAWDLVHDPPTPVDKRKGSLVTTPAGGRPCHHPCSTGSGLIENGRIVRSGRLPLRFQKAWESMWNCKSEPKGSVQTSQVGRSQECESFEENYKEG